jgi:hypothetical protein
MYEIVSRSRPRPNGTTSTLALAALAVAAVCSGCGHTGSNLNTPQVTRAFAAAGVRLYDLGPVFGTKVEGLADEPLFSLKPQEMAVEVFPTVRLARYAQAIGGNEEDTEGNQIKPLARVRNVLITLYPPTARDVRQRALKAVSQLRQLTPP